MFIQAFGVFPGEAGILGRLLTGYTEIEYQRCFCAGMGGGGDVGKTINQCEKKFLFRSAGFTSLFDNWQD